MTRRGAPAAFIDYYDVLAVSPTASQHEIRTAFRRQMLEAHPDKNPGRRQWSERRVRQLIEAYDVIGEAASREDFDRRHRAYRRVGRPRPQRRPFYFHRSDSESRALLVLHYLLHNQPMEACVVLREMESRLTRSFLAVHLDRKDYLDCLFLLAEYHQGQGEYREAASRLREFYLHDRESRYRRHYYDEVVRRLKDLYLRKMPRHATPEEVVDLLGDVEELGLTPSEDRLRFWRLAEAHMKRGRAEAARAVLSRAREAHPGAKEVTDIEVMISGARTAGDAAHGSRHG